MVAKGNPRKKKVLSVPPLFNLGVDFNIFLGPYYDFFNDMIAKVGNFNPTKKWVLPIAPLFKTEVKTTTKCNL
jgi:hypothetical protein